MNIIKSQIESLLFISAKPMSVKQLAGLIKKKENEVKEAAEGLVEDYKTGEKGVRIIKDGFKYQMVSSPENAEVIKEFVKDETSGELTRPSLETLTIIAYRGPVAKTDLDRIRGVNCSLILRNLLMRGLVEAKQDKQKGETYYTVTFDFIRFLGINSVEELPDFERLSKDDAIDRMLEGEGNNENG
jgi:segregation and condensation protein B